MSKQLCDECGNKIHSKLGAAKCATCIMGENDD